MITNDMKLKRERAREKVNNAIKEHGGTTLLSTGITGDDARMAKAAVEAGAKMLEPNHPAYALSKGLKGVTTMDEAEEIRFEVDLEEMAGTVKGIREVVSDDIFITVGIPGGFTELIPVVLEEEDFLKISKAGADGLHTHKSSIKDLEKLVDMAHNYGLLVDAYIAHSEDKHPFGIIADTSEEVEKTAKKMEDIGVDMIGLMTGMSYEGVEAGEIASQTKERLKALNSTVNVPTLAEGGINEDNYTAFADTGVDVLVVGTAIDDLARKGVKEAIKIFI